MDKFLYEAAFQGHYIITVNDRLARHLSRQYDLIQQSSAREAWLRPKIMSLTSWLNHSSRDLPYADEILNQSQSLRLWETIVAEDSERCGNLLLQTPQTARRALQAHRLLLRHAVDFRPSECAEDHRAFLRWRNEWRQTAAANKWRDSAEIPWLLAEALATGQKLPPEQIIFAGFDEVLPDLAQLITVLEGQGVVIERWQAQPFSNNLCQGVGYLDPADEVRCCARWIRRILSDKPEARIGVVAPQLEVYQQLIENIFFEELDPGGLIEGVETPRTFNISLGHSLGSEGIIAVALELLRSGSRIDFASLSLLLLTPYLGKVADEGPGRALLERELRQTGQPEWSLVRLPRSLEGLIKRTGRPLPDFLHRIQVLQSDQTHRKRRLPGDWAEHFARLLHRLGWPGDRGLSSREHQSVQQFRELLGEMASHDRVSSPLQRETAASQLQRLVSNREFQPEGVESPVQVLGVLESSGLSFDHLWVLGLHDTALPRPAAPNPFIPLPLQRRERMQRADAEREQQFASQVADRLFRAAPEVILSWPLQDNSGRLRPSSLIKDFAISLPELADSQAPVHLIHEAKPQLEELLDCQAPPLCSRKPFSGGTGILKDQALCPFRAFAHHRLRCEGLETPEAGIDHRSRGSLAHTVLELFWKETVSLESLLKLDDLTLETRLDSAANKAIERHEKSRRSDLLPRQRAIEQRRLVALVRQWLSFEKKRGSFKVVATEAFHQLTLGNLQIRTRVDRIDELADGRHAIIDYKTGRADPLQWLEERITDPQLPAYSLGFSWDELGAVMFAVVRGKEKESGFCGVARDGQHWPKEALPKNLSVLCESKGWHSFDDILVHWKDALPALGDAFVAGKAAVDPIDRELACTYCDLKPLCRIDEQEQQPVDMEVCDD